ncbi:hypothetical protein [Thermoactinospora rubra]|uniref:hypothetical protein n=1 Tax=Thermoactinospora rubra TaxID=1088767 RepID=UPI00118106F0|nr:hypothetical protein [Thermoactinospora rubra]
MRNPGRQPDPSERIAAEAEFAEAARQYYEGIAEPTRRFHEAIAKASGPPPSEPGMDKSLVTRQRISEITKEMDPTGEGLTVYAIRGIVDAVRTP